MSRIKIGVRNEVESVTWYNAIELNEPKSLDFWEWLNADWKEWLNCFSIWWLKRRELLQETAHKKVSLAFETVEFDDREIIKQIRHHMDALCYRYGEYPSVVYIGRDLHAQVIRFHLDLPIMRPSLHPDSRSPHPITTLLGVEVVFVPWMDGIFAWNPNYASR